MGLALSTSLPDAVYTAVDWGSFAREGAVDVTNTSLYRKVLKAADKALHQAFIDGEGASVLVHSRAKIIDYLLVKIWDLHGLQTLRTAALVAVGGYGRGELHPGSDIDLMLLLAQGCNPDAEQRLGTFLTFLWDIGLPIGHSVRTVDDCVREAHKDVTVATNLMESRLLAGSVETFNEMQERTGPKHIWASREFFYAKWQEQQLRHHRYGDTAYKLEPNVKEGPGGLRDIQMVGWVAKRHLNASNLHELVNQGFLTEEEYRTLIAGQSFLWRVRFALHMLSGRAEDRLLFDHQCELAALFGYTDEDHNLAVEQFMQRYYRTVMRLERLNEMLLQLYQEAILYANQAEKPIPINRRFQARRGFLEVTHDSIFQRSPSALLEIFLILQQHPELKGVRASTIRLIRKHRNLLAPKHGDQLEKRSLFMEILRQPRGITNEFRRMHRYGILSAYWPSFARIVGRMQYDLFHTYTVDEHILFVLRNVRRFDMKEYQHVLPFCSQLIKEIPKPELLYLAALFHDIAKGRGGDHSNLGAEEAETFCLQHDLSGYDARLVAWLVRYHLLMSMTAQRQDIGDPDVINEFARCVGSLNRLNYLYLLTVADIRGTNPDLWNDWKDSLLIELYFAAKHAIHRGFDNPILHAEMIEEVKTTALHILEVCQLSRDTCERLWLEFDAEYFLRHSADEIAWHTQSILQGGVHTVPRVLIRQSTARGSTEIFIYTRDHNHLFAHITTVLSRLGLNILDARIITTHAGYTLDTFMVLGESGKPITEDYRIDEIISTLLEMLRDPHQTPQEVSRRAPRKVKYFNVPTSIRFDNDPKSNTTVMELITADHPGLLSNVGKAFIESDVLVNNARITTIGARAEDVFYVTGLDRQPINARRHQKRIREGILRQLNGLSE